MASNPSHMVTVTVNDQSGEKGNMKINLSAPLDLAAPPLPFTDLLGSLVAELTIGLFTQYQNSAVRRITNVAEGGGNREDKLLMIYEDLVTLKVYTSELPCRKTTLTTVGVGSDSVPPATWADTKLKWDAFVKSPDGNATSLLDVQIIGRNV